MQRRRVLLIHEPTDDSEIYEQGLQMLGFEVLSMDRFEGLNGGAPAADVVVLHIGSDGWESCERLSRFAPRVPVIALTAAVRPDGDNRRRAREARNCAAFVGKPCTHTDLGLIIERVLAGERDIELTSGRRLHD